MSTTDSELIELFEDGKLPSGANFREFIVAKVNVAEFDKLVASFEEWKTRNEVQIGPDGAGWDLLQDGPARLDLRPNDGNTVENAHAFVDLYGWTKTYGLIGKVQGTSAFSAPEPDLDPASLQSVASDGRWKVLMDMPGRISAFQVTAATAQPAEIEKVGFGTVLRWLAGYVPPANAILHATATATDINARPHLSNTSTTTASDILRQLVTFLLGLGVLALIFGMVVDTEVRIAMIPGEGSASPDSYLGGVTAALGAIWDQIAALPLAGQAAGIIAVLYIARRIFEWITARRNGLRLRWKRSGGSLMKGTRTWRLEVRGPNLSASGDARLYFHITALWG